MRYYGLALARAEERLRRLETYRDTARGHAGVVHNPGWLELRVEKARKQVADLKAKVEAAGGGA